MRVYSSGRSLARTALAVAALAVLATPAAAQRRTGVIAGTVKDETGKPIPDVEITAIKSGAAVRTDTAGAFVLSRLPAGSIDMSFRRLAFAPILLSLQLPADDTTEIEVTLSVVAEKLTGVIVLADPDRRRILDAFEARRKMGIGHFITRADIVDRNPLVLSDMLRTVPGMRLVPTALGRTVVRFSRAGMLDCPPQYFVDGMQVTNFSLDDMPPSDVEGVELYGGAAGVPPEYNRLRSTVNCGAVIIWTRIPGAENATP